MPPTIDPPPPIATTVDSFPGAVLNAADVVLVNSALVNLAWTGSATLDPLVAAKLANVSDPTVALRRILEIASQGKESNLMGQIYAIATNALKKV